MSPVGHIQLRLNPDCNLKVLYKGGLGQDTWCPECVTDHCCHGLCSQLSIYCFGVSIMEPKPKDGDVYSLE